MWDLLHDAEYPKLNIFRLTLLPVCGYLWIFAKLKAAQIHAEHVTRGNIRNWEFPAIFSYLFYRRSAFIFENRGRW